MEAPTAEAAAAPLERSKAPLRRSPPVQTGLGGLPWEGGKTWREQNPVRLAKAFKTPILVSVGENDFRVPLNQTLENWSVLQRLRVPSRLLVWPDENHWILKAENSRKFYAELHAWLAKYLGS